MGRRKHACAVTAKCNARPFGNDVPQHNGIAGGSAGGQGSRCGAADAFFDAGVEVVVLSGCDFVGRGWAQCGVGDGERSVQGGSEGVLNVWMGGEKFNAHEKGGG